MVYTLVMDADPTQLFDERFVAVVPQIWLAPAFHGHHVKDVCENHQLRKYLYPEELEPPPAVTRQRLDSFGRCQDSRSVNESRASELRAAYGSSLTLLVAASV